MDFLSGGLRVLTDAIMDAEHDGRSPDRLTQMLYFAGAFLVVAGRFEQPVLQS